MDFEEEFMSEPTSFGFDDFELDQIDSAPEEEDSVDLTDVKTMLTSDDWVNNPEKRNQMAGKASSLIHQAVLDTPDKKVLKSVYRDGEKTEAEVPLLNVNGRINENGRTYINRAIQVLDAAAKDENGGVVYNEMTGRVEVASWVKQAMSQTQETQKPEEMFPELDKFISEQKSLGENNPINYEDYLGFRGSKIKDVTESEKKAFNKQVAQMTFDPSSMGEEEIGRVVEGMPIINPANRHEINKVESWVSSLEGFTDIQKRLMLDDYYDTIDRDIVDYARMFSAADAGVVGSIFSRPLMEELQAHLEGGGTGVDFLRANQSRMTKDAYSAWSEIGGTFRDAVMSIGTGATWLAGATIDLIPGVDGVGELASRPAQLWGELADETASAYRNNTLLSIGGFDIKRRDLTELVGQVGSFVALGGVSALTGKITGSAAARLAAQKSAQLAAAAGAETAVGLGQKSLNFIKAIATDQTAYIGGIQASGTSFGKTYNQILQATGNEEEAYKEASIQGISDGLSALIATSVMNRVAPGLERVMGAPEGKLSGSIIQRARAAGASKAAMEETKTILNSLKSNLTPELRKQFTKDLAKSARASMTKAGLRGYGAGADILAEGVEESLDEVLSDVIEVMVDDSKTWDKDGWAQIQQNWRGYVKAGVLGALGGAMGSAKGTLGSGFKALGKDADRKEFIKNSVNKEWDVIKANVKQFDNHELIVNVAGKGVGKGAVKIGEILSSNMSIKEKSEYLMKAARSPQKTFSSLSQDATVAPDAATGTPSADAPLTGESEAPQFAPDSKEGILSSLGYKAPAGKVWKADLSIEESKNTSKGKDKGVEIVPLTIGGISMAGAKVVTSEKGGQPSVRYVSAGEAATLVKNASIRRAFENSANNTGLDGSNTFLDIWTDNAPSVTPSETSTTSDRLPGQGTNSKELLSKIGYELAEDEDWNEDVPYETDPIEMESLPKKEGFKSRSLNPIKIGDVEYAGARLEETNDKGETTIRYITAEEAIGLAESSKAGFIKAAELIKSGNTKWKKKKDGSTEGKETTDDSGFDVKVPSTEPDGKEVAGDAERTGTDETAGDRKDGKEGSPPTAGETDEVKPEGKSDSEPEEKKNFKDAPKSRTDRQRSSIWGDVKSRLNKIKIRNVIEGPRPEVANISANAANYLGDEKIWVDLQRGQVGISPEFVDEVINNPDIEKKAEFIASEVQKVVGNNKKVLRALPVAETPSEAADPFRATPEYIVPANELEGTPDAAGGRWRTLKDKKSIYAYSPASGKIISPQVGDVVSIGGDLDNVLVFLRADENGDFIYVKVNMSEFGSNLEPDAESKSKIRALNEDWQKSKLLQLAIKIKPQLAAILSGDTSEASKNEFRKIIKAVIKEVAPGKTFVENSDPNANFIQSVIKVETVPDGPIKGAPFETDKSLPVNKEVSQDTKTRLTPVMEINLEKTIKEIQSLLGEVNLSNPKAPFLVSMEISRLLSRWIEEEQIHLITMESENFSEEKLRSFVEEIAEDKKHPLYDLFVSTVNERAPGASPTLDSSDENAMTQEEAYVVASELLRKVQQIRTTGSFSEIATNDAKRLVYSFAVDARAGKDLFKVAAEMVRRYMDRIRKVLWFRSVRAKLSKNQIQILDALNAEYIRQNILGDVDFVKQKTSEFLKSRLDSYSDATDIELGKIASKYTDPLMELRDIVDEFGALEVSDVIDVNENFELIVRPQILKFMEREGSYDINRINEVLNQLNASDSYKRAWTEVYLARDLMVSRESELDFDPSDFFKVLAGDIFDPEGAMAQIIKSVPRDVENSEFIYDRVKEVYEKAKEERETIEKEIVYTELNFIENLQIVSPKDLSVLFEKAKFYGLPLDPDSFENGTYSSYQDLKNKIKSRAVMLLEDSDTLSRVAKSFSDKAKVFPNYDYSQYAENLERAKASENKALETKNKVFSSFNKDGILDLTGSSQSEENAASVRRLQNQRAAYERGADMKLAKERYQKLKNYFEAVDDYNKKLKSLKQRAIGQESLDTKEHGTYIRDARFSGKKMTLGYRKFEVDEATEPSDVFYHNYYSSTEEARIVPGDGFPRNWNDNMPVKDRLPMRLHSSTIDSNATFIGRKARMKYYVADLMGKLPSSFDHRLYQYGAGFAFGYTLNDFGQPTYESPTKAFPRFDGFDELFGVDRDLEKDEDYSSIGLSNLINYITKAEAWLDHIDQRIDSGKIISEVAGVQTPAGRAVILIEPRFKELRNHLENFKEIVVVKLSGYVEYDEYSEGDFASRFKRDEKGDLILTSDSPSSVFKAVKEEIKASRGTKFAQMKEAQLAANSAIKLTRRMVRSFIDPKWINNLEKDAMATVRNASYTSDNPEMLELRDAILDPAIMKQMMFALTYFAENEYSDYWIGPMYAFDALKEYESISGRGSEQKGVRGRVKTKRVREGDNKGEVYTKYVKASDDDIVFTYGESGNDDPRIGKSNAGERGVTLKSFLGEKFSEKMTGAELAANAEDAANQALKKFITTQLMFIGYHSNNSYGDANDARDFAFAVMRKELHGEGNTDDLIESAISGVFPNIIKGTKRFEDLVTEFHNQNKSYSLKEDNGPSKINPKTLKELEEIGNRINAEKFVVDILEFKRKYEYEALKNARFEKNETIAVLSDALDASDHPQEEKEAMKRLINKGFVSGDIVAFDSRLIDQDNIYLGENPGLSILLMNLIGETIIVQPKAEQESKTDSKIGMRVIPGKDGQPNIVWAPNAGASRMDQMIAIQTILSHYGQDPAMKEVISDLAGTIRNTLLPAFDLEQTERSIQHHLDKLPDEKKKSFKKAALSHFIRLSRMTDDISGAFISGTSSVNTGRFVFGKSGLGRVPQPYELPRKSEIGFASDIALVTSVLTDPKYKETFDRGYIGNDIAEDFSVESGGVLASQTIDALHLIVKRMRETDGEYVYWAEENATDDEVSDATNAIAEFFDDVDQEFDTTAGREDPTVSEMMKMYGLDDEILKQKFIESEKQNQTANPNALIAMIDPERLKPKQWEEILPPSDMVLFNVLGKLVSFAKTKNLEARSDQSSYYSEERGGRIYLSQSPSAILRKIENENPLVQPIFKELNRQGRGDFAPRRYVGSAINLTRPNVEGHTMLKMQMDAARSMTQQASWLSKVKGMEELLEQALLSKESQMRSGKVPKINFEIVLDESFMRKAAAIIPQLPAVREQVENAIKGIDETEKMLLDKIDEADRILNEPLKWSKEAQITEAMQESEALKREMASLIVDLAQSISGSANETLAYEKAVTNHAIKTAINQKYGDYASEMIHRIDELYRFIRARDNAPEGDLDGSGLRAGANINRSLQWFNTAINQINEVANDVVKGRLSQAGLKPTKASSEKSIWAEKVKNKYNVLSIFKKDAASITLADVDAFAKKFNQGNVDASKILFNVIFDGAQSEFTSSVLSEFAEEKSKQSKGKRQIDKKKQDDEIRNKIIDFIKQAKDLNQDQIFSLIDRGFDLDDGSQNGELFNLLNRIALNTVEAHELFAREAETGNERDKRELARDTKNKANKDLMILRDQKIKMFETNGLHYVGKFRYLLDEKLQNGNHLAANVHITLTHRLTAESASESDLAKFREDANERKNFVILREALTKSLDEIVDGRLDEMYKKLRGQVESFKKFNPVELVIEAQRRVSIEDSIFKDQMDKIQGLTSDANFVDMNADAIAFMTNSSDALYSVRRTRIEKEIEKAIEERLASPVKLSENQIKKIQEAINSNFDPEDSRFVSEEKKEKLRKVLAEGVVPVNPDKIRSEIESYYRNKFDAKLKFNRLPANFSKRRELIGEVFNDPENDSKVVLLPVNAKERLMKAFPKITSRNVNSTLKTIVLKSLSQSDGYPAFMDEMGPPTHKFRGSKFNLTKDLEGISAVEAADLFVERFEVGLANYLKGTRNNKDVDLTGPNSKRAVALYSKLIRKIVYAYNADALIKEDGSPTNAQKAIEKLLKSIDNQGNITGDLGFDASSETMQNFDLIDTFSLVFATIESEQIMQKLVSGIYIQEKTVPQAILKYAHHQDARNRSKFLRNHIARDTAIHLQAYLERGFDGDSGRERHQTAHKDAQNKIAQASNKIFGIKGNAKDQAIGYILAQLDGLSDASNMTLTQALGTWKKTMDRGWADLKSLDSAQSNAFKGKAKRFFNANHVDMIRDIPMIASIHKKLKESQAFSDFGFVEYSNEYQGEEEAKDANSRKVIKALKDALIEEAENKEGVKEYGKVIYDQLLDAYNATAVTRAVISRKIEEDVNMKSGNKKDDQGITPTVQAYSSVPIKLAYASNPDPTVSEIRVATEGKWIPDPADVVDIRKSSFYGGLGRHVKPKENAPVLRPMSLNGLSAPFAILEDSIYRNNITPNYLILRKLLGRVQNASGVPVVDNSMMFSTRVSLKPRYEKEMKNFNVAIAAVASEIETMIFNDSQTGVENTAFSQAVNFTSSMFAVRALASLQQLWNQTLPPAAFFVIKKMAIKRPREAYDFIVILSKLMGSMVADFAKSPANFFGNHEDKNQFHHKATQFVKDVSPFVFFRGVDGSDQTRDALRHQTRFNQSKFKSWGGRALKEYQNVGESALNFTIGSGERLISKAIFLSELMAELKKRKVANAPNTIEDLLNNFNARNIPIIANQTARIKVNDMMGQSDISKKAALFQNKAETPGWSALWKSLTRFSNHTASTGSNMTVFMPAFTHGDEQTRQDAIENIVGTLGQNIMFQFFKIHTLLPIALSVFYWFDGDDPEEAARKAQEKSNEILGSEDSGPIASMFKQLAFGSEKELFDSNKKMRAALGSAQADLLAKTLMEGTQAIPAVGVLFGYSPINAMAKPIVNYGSEHLVSLASRIGRGKGVPVAQAWYERDAIGIKQYKPNPIESVASITAPTSVVYDAFDTAALSYQAIEAGASTIDVLTYMASELVPFLRDYRSAKAQELRKEIKKDKE